MCKLAAFAHVRERGPSLRQALRQPQCTALSRKSTCGVHRQKKAGKTAAESFPPFAIPPQPFRAWEIGLSAACSSIWSLPLPFAASVRKGGRKEAHTALRKKLPRTSCPLRFLLRAHSRFFQPVGIKSTLFYPSPSKGAGAKTRALSLRYLRALLPSRFLRRCWILT
jgi:hypothetical protein